jgi:hypothetical protein
VSKLEKELEVIIFDRSKMPVIPTEVGAQLIAQAKKVVSESKGIYEMIAALKGDISGVIKLGIIPTLAPYLLPLFVMLVNSVKPLDEIRQGGTVDGGRLREGRLARTGNAGDQYQAMTLHLPTHRRTSVKRCGPTSLERRSSSPSTWNLPATTRVHAPRQPAHGREPGRTGSRS